MLNTTIVPGKVVNNGIVQGDKKTPVMERRTIAAHLPVFSGVFPKGPVSDTTNFISLSSLTSVYGDISDPNTPYYNPLSVAIKALKDGGQSTVGIRSLSGNKAIARWTLECHVKATSIKTYKRNEDGSLELDELGLAIVESETKGLHVTHKINEFDSTKEIGSLEKRSYEDDDGDLTWVYPVVEFEGGIGEYYNDNGINFGVNPNTGYTSISSFVESNGVYPFYFKMFRIDEDGLKITTNTTNGADNTTFTFFNFANKYGTKYGSDVLLDAYNGTDLSGNGLVRDQPVNDVYVYDEFVDELCLTLYGFETQNENSSVSSEFGEFPHRQMNFLTGVDHKGNKYNSIEIDQLSAAKFKTLTNLMMEGGINKFKDDKGKWLVSPKTTTQPPLLTFNPIDEEYFDRYCGWEATQQLVLNDLINYKDSLEFSNVTKNRQSVWWDLGYNDKIKSAAIEMYGKRKDMIIVMTPSIWNEEMEVDDYYSMAESLNTRLLNYLESEEYGTAQCRSSINLWTAKVIGEETKDYFTTNIDLMYKFARSAGNSSGFMYDSPFPTNKEERILSYQYDPLITFEADTVSANNFLKGCITLRDYDWQGVVYRPALPTTFTDTNSVLKDLTNVFIDVCIEKILQDLWNEVCGTPGNKEMYKSFIKTEGEKIIMDRFGAVLGQPAIVVPTYYENTNNGDSILYTTVHVPHNKASYMMELTLIAYNADNFNSSDIEG